MTFTCLILLSLLVNLEFIFGAELPAFTAKKIHFLPQLEDPSLKFEQEQNKLVNRV